jgi:partner of Y14 and mago protein
MPSQPTNAGIVTDEASGERHIPESKRADGSTRKAIKIRPGYRPPEDVEVYKNRTAENFRNRGKGPVPGAEGLKDDNSTQSSSASANKNAKRREARKKAKAAEGGAGETNGAAAAEAAETEEATKKEEANPEAEKEKRVRNLKKKLRQAKELKEKKETGESLLPEQIAKVIKINELIRELDALGFDPDGEPKPEAETVGMAG